MQTMVATHTQIVIRVKTGRKGGSFCVHNDATLIHMRHKRDRVGGERGRGGGTQNPHSTIWMGVFRSQWTMTNSRTSFFSALAEVRSSSADGGGSLLPCMPSFLSRARRSAQPLLRCSPSASLSPPSSAPLSVYSSSLSYSPHDELWLELSPPSPLPASFIMCVASASLPCPPATASTFASSSPEPLPGTSASLSRRDANFGVVVTSSIALDFVFPTDRSVLMLTLDPAVECPRFLKEDGFEDGGGSFLSMWFTAKV